MQTLSTFPAPAADRYLPSSAELALTLLGPSTAMSQVWSQIRRLAPHMRTLLLCGAPDSGQEAVARLMLDLSPQPRRLFLSLRAADAEDRLTSSPGSLPNEVFLYLPDADRLSPVAQEAILRLLRGRRPHAVSVVAVASDNLRALVSLGRFSAELADLLSAVRISIPSLAERREDVPMLLSQMITIRCQARLRPVPQLSEALLRAAMQHAWSGNLRELAETAEELLKGNDSKSELDLQEWTRALAIQRAPKPMPAAARLIRLDTVIQEHIYSVLRACGGNKLRAAEILGISRSTLYRLLEGACDENSMPLAS